MSDYKLHYFNIRGKAELARLVFAAAGQDYQDLRYKSPMAPPDSTITLEWNDETKAATPLGQMPVLEVDGQKFCQQSAIARYLAKKFGLMGDDEIQAFKVDMVVETMWPDVAGKFTKFFFEKDEEKKAKMQEEALQAMPKLLGNIAKWVEGDFVLGDKLSLADLAIFDVLSNMLAAYPDIQLPDALKQVMDNVKNHSNVKKWLDTRPETKY